MFKFEQTETIGILTLRGNLTKYRLTELKRVLIAAMANADDLFLNVARVSHIDASCARLLGIARRNAKALGKHLTLVGTAGKPFKRLLEADPQAMTGV